MQKNNNKKLAMALMLNLFADAVQNPNKYRSKPEEEIQHEKESAEERNNFRRGLSLFQHEDNYLFALNQKNADGKAKKKGWI